MHSLGKTESGAVFLGQGRAQSKGPSRRVLAQGSRPKGPDPQAVAQWSGARLRLPPGSRQPAKDGFFCPKWHDLAWEPTFWADSLHTRPVSGAGAVRTGFGAQNGRRTAENGRNRPEGRPGYTVKLPINRPWRPTSMVIPHSVGFIVIPPVRCGVVKF